MTPSLPPAERPWRWWLLLGVALAVLTGVAQLAGDRDATEDLPAFLQVIAKPVGLGIAATLGLILALYGVRRLRFVRHARRPGPIAVLELVDTTGIQAPVQELTLQLRGRLTAIDLHAPGPQPGPAASVGFLEQLRTAIDKPSNVIATVAGLLNTLPSHAYRVEGLIVRREAAPGYGVAVQVTAAPNRLSPPQTFWARDWEDAIEQAAIYVAALILPRTRKCREAPWSAWEGRPFPPELLDAYQRARTHHQARRYDEALGAYFEALAIDPLNVELRLEVGRLQEQLALWLDALATYSYVLELTRSRPKRRRGQRRARRRARSRAHIIAMYRSAVLMGFGNELARQWRKWAADGEELSTARDHERERLRRLLRESLSDKYGDAVERDLKRDRPPSVHELLQSPKPPQPDAATTELWLREPFHVAATRVGHDLLRYCRLRRLNATRTGLTRRSLRIYLLWTRLHRDRTRSQASRKPLGATQPTFTERARRVLSLDRRDPTWPPAPDELRYNVGKRLRWWQGGRRRFADHYNAACTYAVPLLDQPVGGGRREEGSRSELATAAVRELHKATLVASSDHVMLRRAWLVSEDPDLAGLRARPEFRTFETSHFPQRTKPETRPQKAHMLELSRHTSRLVRHCARELENQWHARVQSPQRALDVHDVEGWWRQERRAWELAAGLAVDHQYWPMRLEVVAEMARLTDELALAYPDYLDEPVIDDGAPRALEAAASNELTAADHRLKLLAKALSTDPIKHALEQQHDKWATYLKTGDASGRPLERAALTPLFNARAALWRSLHDWFDSDPDPQADAPPAGFCETVKGLPDPPASA